MENFVKVCSESDIADGDIKSVDINGATILIAKYENVIYALDDICSHDGAELSNGDLVECQIQCERHGARFDLKTGEATQMPAIAGINSYEVKIIDGVIYVELGD